jgi:DNA-binding SARP family transcriptional activator
MQVRLLGPVDVMVDGVARPVQGLRRRAVLAALALHAGEIVSTDRLINIVWGDDPSPLAAQTVQSHVSHLRGVLGERSAILARAPGYVLDRGADGTDVQAAEDLIRRGSRSADAVAAATRLQAAVQLWRGPALADITGLVWFDEQAQRLEKLLQQARHDLIDARLRLGQHFELIAELQDLVRQNPHHEHTHAQLILALYRSGRQSDALAAYHRLRQTLDESLGIGPSPALRELETAILRQDPAIDAPPHPSTALTAPGPIPAQLPLVPAGFTGRQAELAALDRLLSDTTSPAVIISAVSGTAGIGKTTLAIHWAHRVAARFPDGQLHVNLRGYDPTGNAIDPAEALRGFLDALNIPTDRIPTGLHAQAALYRTHLAGKRVLVLLDNARDADQVRHLLPAPPAASPSSPAATSSPASSPPNPPALSSSTCSPPPKPTTSSPTGSVPPVPPPNPTPSTTSSPDCARLPLALAIVAARAATQPTFPLATIANELARTTNTLDTLHGGDPASDIRAVFSWSLNTLAPDANQLFRHLALHPGPDITTAATASLAGIPPHRARPAPHPTQPSQPPHPTRSRPIRLPRPPARLRRRADPHP